MNYHEYLKSEEWATRRRSALIFARNRCQACNSSRDLEVHHRTYERLGDEPPEDLTVLCAKCHRTFHGRLPDPPILDEPPRRTLPRLGAERQLLLMMVRDVEWVERARELISAEDFEDPHYGAAFEVLISNPYTRSAPLSMDVAAAQRFNEILSDPEEVTQGIDVFTKSVNRMRVSSLDRRIQHLQTRIEAAATVDDKLGLTSEKARLARELRELDPNYWTSYTRAERPKEGA